MSRSASMNAQTARQMIVDIIVAKRERDAQTVASLQSIVTRFALTTMDFATFGLVNAPSGSNVCTATATSTSLLCSENAWTADDAGKTIYVQGAGTAGATHKTTIAAYVSPTEIVMTDPAVTTTLSSNASVGIAVWGWDAVDQLDDDPQTNSGGKLQAIRQGNQTLAEIVAAAVAAATTPAGFFGDFGGTVAPAGWLECDGSVVSQATYANLFAAIGTTWDTGGEGAGNFRLPSMQRRVRVGRGGVGTGTLGNAVGNTGGEEDHTLTVNELAAHGHDYHGAAAGPGSGVGIAFFTTLTGTTDNAGGDAPHNNMQPSAVVMTCIKY